jgi:hypothetical protein
MFLSIVKMSWPGFQSPARCFGVGPRVSNRMSFLRLRAVNEPKTSRFMRLITVLPAEPAWIRSHVLCGLGANSKGTGTHDG